MIYKLLNNRHDYRGELLKISDFLPYLKSAAIMALVSICLIYPGCAAARDITLEWVKSIDDPYLQSYKIYYYTTSGDAGSISEAYYAASYTLADGILHTIDPHNPMDAPAITIPKDNTRITLHFTNNTPDYYFVLTAIDTRGLEGVPTTPEVSLIKLTVAKTGTGTGTVTGLTPGYHSDINCGAACTADYTGTADTPAAVTLKAQAVTGNFFTGWSDGCSGTAQTCTVTVIPNAKATANFELLRTLDVLKTGVGKGTVTSSPSVVNSGINCGWSGCTESSADYIIGTTAQMTAAPAPGSFFAGWSGGGCTGTGACNVTMDEAKNFTARFLLIGDVNQDGFVNLADAILVLRVLFGYLDYPGPPGIYANAGVNGDGKLRMADVLYILQKAAGLR